MHNVWLIARREYIERVRTRGFMVTTIMIPVLMGGFIFGSTFLGSKANHDTHLAVVSSDTQLALDLQTELQPHQAMSEVQSDTTRQPRIVVDAMDDSGPQAAQATRDTLDEELDSGDLDGYLWITPATAPGGRPTFTFTPRSSREESIKNTLAAALSRVLLREQLAHRGIVATDADTMLQPVEIVAARVPRHEDHESAEISVGILFFLMYMVIMLYGMNVARSIIEEKTSRIFEVLLATIRPEEMMAGKIIGVGSVGLTQVSIWIAAGLIFAGSSIATRMTGQSMHIGLTGPQIAYFFVYFALGYVFYSSIAAALGAMTNSEQELQQLNLFLVMPLAFCFIVMRTVMITPDSMMSRVLSLVPPFTPLLMYLRVSLGHPSRPEIIASIVLTTASIYAIIWVTSRIYRVGVLMYGKRPTLPEIFRWLKYS